MRPYGKYVTEGSTPAQSNRTCAATRARMKAYDKKIKAILPVLRKSRRRGATASWQFINDLNFFTNITAPNGKPWNKSSFRRAVRRLKHLGLDVGLLPPHYAREYGTNPRHSLEELTAGLRKRCAILRAYRGVD